MASMIEIVVFLEAANTIQNPERVGKQASDAIANLLHQTYQLGAADEENPTVRLRAVAFNISEAATLPGTKIEKKKK